MIPTNEPKDGDFIAYLEQLQKQQVARLHGMPAAEDLNSPQEPQAATPKAARGTNRSERRDARHRMPGLASAVVPLFIGFAIGLHWFFGGSGLPGLLIAVALVAYGAKQLQRIRREQSAEHSAAATRVAQMLGQIRK